MTDPQISIIVPVYKVEPYLRKCLDSIVNQTYQNLEVILVDDGSPDNCGAICDEYAAKDSRIQVIHQENGGLSAARNAGLRVASGAYLGFVDSDDWIEPDMYRYLIDGLLKADADIAVCGWCEECGNHQALYTWQQSHVLDTEQALMQLLGNNQMQNAVWDKLYRRAIFTDIWFPEGRTYEDLAVMHWLFIRAGKVVCLPEIMYHYLQRPDSIVGDISLANRINHYISAKIRYDELKNEYPQFEKIMAAQCVASAVSIWSVYFANSKEDRSKFWSQIQQISAFAKDCYKEGLAQMNLGAAGRIIMRLIPYTTWWAFAGARLCALLYQLKHGRTL